MVINPKVIHQSNSRPKSEGKFFIFSEFSNSFLFVKTYKIHFKVIELDLARPMVDISISYTIFWDFQPDLPRTLFTFWTKLEGKNCVHINVPRKFKFVFKN